MKKIVLVIAVIAVIARAFSGEPPTQREMFRDAEWFRTNTSGGIPPWWHRSGPYAEVNRERMKQRLDSFIQRAEVLASMGTKESVMLAIEDYREALKADPGNEYASRRIAEFSTNLAKYPDNGNQIAALRAMDKLIEQLP